MLTTLPDFLVESVPPTTTQAQRSLLRAFIQKPLQTGAIVASGTKLSKKLALMAEVDQANVVVELGSGSGVVTEHIMKSVAADSQVMCLELDSQMAQQTKRRCPKAVVYNSDALLLRAIFDGLGIDSCDSIVSSIPWANFSLETQRSILASIDSVLKPGGIFTTFAYLHGIYLPSARRFYQELSERYSAVESSPVVWANVPPALVYKVVKSR